MATTKRKSNKNVAVNSSFLLLICFVFVTGFTLLFLSSKVFAKEGESFTITSRTISLPTEEDFKNFEKTHNELLADFKELQNLKDEIESLYNEVEASLVCSIANRNFNSLEESFNAYETTLSEVKEHISAYEALYNLIEELPKFSYLYRQRQEELSNFASNYEYICETNEQYIVAKEELSQLYLNAKTIADDFFEEYYDPVCCLVYVESGNCSAKEQFCTAEVIDNRIMSPDYPDNLYDVIHQPGQYSTVEDGSFDIAIPSDEVKQNMENFLRGRVETIMPSNVVGQARFIQGEIWWASDSGQYFCYPKN